MRHVTVLALFLSIPTLAAGQPLQSELSSQFEQAVQWTKSNGLFSNSGLVLRTADVFQTTVESGESFKGVTFITDDGCVKVQSRCVSDGEPVDEDLTHWFVTDVRKESAQLNYADLRYNAFIARGLLRMYDATGRGEYLRRAGEQLGRMYTEMEGEKWMRLRADDDNPTYIARINSMLLQAVYRHAKATDNLKSNRLERLAKSYEFSTEGVWNHWQGAVIGNYVQARVLGDSVRNLARIRPEMERLRTEVQRHDGKMPYVMDRNHPEYPDFRETYQTLMTMYLAKMSAKTSLEVRVPSSYQWPLVWSEAIDMNHSVYWANNNAAALHLLQGTGKLSDDWMIHQTTREIYREPPSTLREAMAQIRGISSLAKYWSLREAQEEPTPSVLRKEQDPTPNPATSHTTVSVYVDRSTEVKMRLYDALGREIRTVRNRAVRGQTLLRQRVSTGDISAGMYFVRVEASGESETFKVMVL